MPEEYFLFAPKRALPLPAIPLKTVGENRKDFTAGRHALDGKREVP
jgi:hypothetical protein